MNRVMIAGVGCASLLCATCAFGHSNNTHGNNPMVNVAGVEFEADEDLAAFMHAVGLIETVMTDECSNTWSHCEGDIFGPFQSELARCIELYQCAYYMCSECSGAARVVCNSSARWDLYNCSGIDLTSLENEWSVDHDTMIEIMRELYD